MKRVALFASRWLNGKPDPRAAHRTIVAVVSAAALIAILSPAPATADHGHNCVWSGGAWVGQGLCPGMPGFVPHTATPTAEPSPTTSEPAPTQTAPPATPSPTTTTPTPTVTPSAPTSSPSTSTPAPSRTGCLRSYGNEWCTGATPSTSTTTPAPVVTGPLVETDIVLYAPEVNPARILR